MLSKHDPIQRDPIKMIALDELVPADNLVRKIEAAINFSFVYDLTGPCYRDLFFIETLPKNKALYHE
jgi:hypothetical protein